MRYHPKRPSIRSILSSCAACALIVAPAGADIMVSGVKGDASAEGAAAKARSSVGDGQTLATGSDGNAAVLLDNSAVVELCNRSKVTFERGSGGNRVVNVQSGTVKLNVEPREPGERIEIHTPAAVATILGTVVYVTVDPVTGATTISSSESQVNIRAKDGGSADGTTISAMESLSVMPGKGEDAKKRVTHEQLAAVGDCLLDFHGHAIEADRSPLESKTADRLAQVDVAVSQIPVVSTAGPNVATAPGAGSGSGDLTDPNNDPPTTPLVGTRNDPPVPPSMMAPFQNQPPCPAGLPGTSCNF